MAIPALVGGVAAVMFSNFVGARVPTQAYAGPLATVAWGYALQAYGTKAWMRDAGTAIVGVGAGMAYAQFQGQKGATSALPARPTTAGYLGEPILFEDRVDPYYRKVANIGLP